MDAEGPSQDAVWSGLMEDQTVLMDTSLFVRLKHRRKNWKRQTVDVSFPETTIFLKEKPERLLLVLDVQREYREYGVTVAFAWAAKILLIRHRSAVKIQMAYRAFKSRAAKRMDTT